MTNRTRGTVLADAAETARTPWAQFVGLMGRATLPAGSGLVFPGTRGVHTHFMLLPIDIVFHDGNGVVIGMTHSLRPWRFSAYHFRAKGAVELPAGTLRASGTQCGDVLRFAETAA